MSDFPSVHCKPPELAGRKELEGYRKFLKEYAQQLKGIEEALDETLGDAWDFTFDPIALQVSIDANVAH